MCPPPPLAFHFLFLTIIYPWAAIYVSGAVVGRAGQVSTDESHYIDGSSGQGVLMYSPAGLARLDNRTLVIAEQYTHMVRLYNTENNVASSLGGKYGAPGSVEGENPLGRSCFNHPTSVAVSPENGNYVYVTNRGGEGVPGYLSRVNLEDNKVETIDGTDGYGYTWGGSFVVSFYKGKNLIAASYDSVWKIIVNDENPKNSTRVKLFDLEVPYYRRHKAVANPRDGSILIVTDRCISQFVRVEGEFVEQKKIGDCDRIGFRDGDPDDARFNEIHSVVWSPGGEVLFIADFRNQRIRYMPHDLSFVRTLAGNIYTGNNPGDGDRATLAYPTGIALIDNRLYFSQDYSHIIRSIGMST